MAVAWVAAVDTCLVSRGLEDFTFQTNIVQLLLAATIFTVPGVRKPTGGYYTREEGSEEHESTRQTNRTCDAQLRFARSVYSVWDSNSTVQTCRNLMTNNK